MKHRLKGLLALVLSLVMVLSMVTVSTASQPSDSGSAPTEYHVSVGGTKVTSANATNVLSDGKVSYDPDTNTLTLNNFTYSGDKIGISATEDLIIKLIGENNTITTTSDFGINVSGDLTINGTGVLTAVGDKYGLSASNVTISGGTVKATGEKYGIFAYNDGHSGGMKVAISGGSVEANATNDTGSIGIYAPGGEIAISGDNTQVTVGCATGLKASTVNILENSTVNITTYATAPAVGKAIDATTLNLNDDVNNGGSLWYRWTTTNGGTPNTSKLTYNGEKYLKIEPITYTATFNANGHGTAPSAQSGIAAGGKVTEPNPAPTAAGWTFGGWYKDQNCTTKWDFNTDTVTADITLYAKWMENSTGGPGSYWSGPNTISPDDSDKSATKTESPKTFDGGIASAVVVTILSATGGAWLAKKKD